MPARGIRSVADLEARCDVDDITGCWRMKTRSGRTVMNVWYAPLGDKVSIGTLIAHLTTGAAPAPGVVWHCTCSTFNCANPAHRKKGDRSSQMLNADLRRDPATIAKIKATKRATSRLSEDDVAAIVASNDTLHALAARFDISVSYASKVRNQQCRSTALAARSSSVFTWGQSR